MGFGDGCILTVMDPLDMSSRFFSVPWAIHIGCLASLVTLLARAQAVPTRSPADGVLIPGRPTALSPGRQDSLPRKPDPPSQQPWPPPKAPVPLPLPDDVFPGASPRSPIEAVPDLSTTITVTAFHVTGSTVFSAADFAKVTDPFLNRPLTFAELFQVRDAVGKLYADRGYITSGALIPPQKLQSGRIELRVLEGRVEAIRVLGLRRLRAPYVRRRLELATRAPLNRNRLLEALQRLQLDPLIASVSASLSAGTQPGQSLLEITVTEAKTRQIEVTLDNGRSPSVGTIRRQLHGTEANLLGLGDRLQATYTHTHGSNALDLGYSLPLNPRNGTLSFNYGTAANTVIEAPFNVLDIYSQSHYYELTLRQPLTQSPTQEFALGLTLSHRTSTATLLDNLPFPGAGADADGQTKLTAVRFFQEWTRRSSQAVVALRSQFSLGFNALGATLNAAPPDSRFLSWRGQAQWVQLLAKDTLLLLRADAQVANRPLLPLEQFGLGGQDSGRGYRQDALLADNGLFASAEVRLPIYRHARSAHLLQLTPFIDVGTAWNQGTSASSQSKTLASLGLGLRWQWGEQVTARLDWGIPLSDFPSSDRTLQEQGIYFSINYRF
jgi:hemolysin activation/secretion protein